MAVILTWRQPHTYKIKIHPLPINTISKYLPIRWQRRPEPWEQGEAWWHADKIPRKKSNAQVWLNAPHIFKSYIFSNIPLIFKFKLSNLPPLSNPFIHDTPTPSRNSMQSYISNISLIFKFRLSNLPPLSNPFIRDTPTPSPNSILYFLISFNRWPYSYLLSFLNRGPYRRFPYSLPLHTLTYFTLHTTNTAASLPETRLGAAPSAALSLSLSLLGRGPPYNKYGGGPFQSPPLPRSKIHMAGPYIPTFPQYKSSRRHSPCPPQMGN